MKSPGRPPPPSMVPGLFSLVPVDTPLEEEYLPPAYLWRQAERTAVPRKITISDQVVHQHGWSLEQLRGEFVQTALNEGWKHANFGVVSRSLSTMEWVYTETAEFSGLCIDRPMEGKTIASLEPVTYVNMAGPITGGWESPTEATYYYRHVSYAEGAPIVPVWAVDTYSVLVYQADLACLYEALHAMMRGRWAASEPELTVDDLIDRWIGAHA